MRVNDEQRAEDGVGDGVGPDERDDEHGDLRDAEQSVHLPFEDVVFAAGHGGGGEGPREERKRSGGQDQAM